MSGSLGVGVINSRVWVFSDESLDYASGLEWILFRHVPPPPPSLSFYLFVGFVCSMAFGWPSAFSGSRGTQNKARTAVHLTNSCFYFVVGTCRLHRVRLIVS